MRSTLSRQFSRFTRSVYSKPHLARLCLSTLLLLAFLLGIFTHALFTHSLLHLARSLDSSPTRYLPITLHNSQQPLRHPPRPLTLISSAYTSTYPASRLAELHLVIARNLHLPSLTHYNLLSEPDANLPAFRTNSTTTLLTTLPQPSKSPITYRKLFQTANRQPSGTVAIIANADIFFDDSILCATFLDARTVLALSRHPAPDCPAASGRGDTSREPQDFCAGYHPVRAASHDVFVVVVPIPEAILDALGDLRVNEFGAENVVAYLFKMAGYRVLNPCANIHAFHLHCNVADRAKSARQRAGSVAGRRRQFAGADRWGFWNVADWADEEWKVRTEGLDCLAFGMANRREGVEMATV